MGRGRSVNDDGTVGCDVVEAGAVSDAFALRERYLKSGQNEAGAKNRRELSAAGFLESLPESEHPAIAEPFVDAEEEALLAELEKEEREEEGVETRNSNDESNPKLEFRNSALSTKRSALSPRESSAEVAARMEAPPVAAGAAAQRYNISEELAKAWDRIVDWL